MKKILATMLFTAAMSGAAFASTITGTVSSWDHADRTFVMNNGESFTVPDGMTAPAIRKGEKLIVTYQGYRMHNLIGVEQPDVM